MPGIDGRFADATVESAEESPDLARHIVNQKTSNFEPDKFEDHCETALIDLIDQKRAGKTKRSTAAVKKAVKKVGNSRKRVEKRLGR